MAAAASALGKQIFAGSAISPDSGLALYSATSVRWHIGEKSLIFSVNSIIL